MICVFKGTGPTDAYLMQHWLERNGVHAQVRGDLSGIRGEIPIAEAWPTLWVHPEDVTTAKDAIARFETPRLVHPAWKCDSCGEMNEPNFGSCWNCDADQPGLGVG